MKAAVLTELNKDLLVADVELTELKPGQVLVKVLVSGICGSQLHEIRGNKGNGKFLPHLMGHEGCGIVEEIGAGVSTVKPGDKVVMHWRPGSGIESPFPQYVLNGTTFSSGKVNTLCEYSIASENRLTVVPEETDPEVAAILGCAMSTALALIDNQIDLKLGESVCVIGTGGVGLNVIQAVSLKGASEIIACDRNKDKNALSIQMGATKFYSDLNDMKEKVDVIIDTTGNSRLLDLALDKCSGQGRVVMVGQPEPEDSLEITNALKLFNGSGLSLRATQGGDTNPALDIPRYLKLFTSGKLSVSNLITHRFSINEINVAFELLMTGSAGRIMINLSEGKK